MSVATILSSAAAAAEEAEDVTPVENLGNLIKQWLRVSAEIDTLTAEIRPKRKQQKELRSMILKIMRTNTLGALNVSVGQVVREQKHTKSSITRKYLGSTLIEFFKGDAEKARECLEWIESHRPVRSTDQLNIHPKPTSAAASVTGSATAGGGAAAE